MTKNKVSSAVMLKSYKHCLTHESYLTANISSFLVLLSQGDYTRAFRHYQTAFSLDPKNDLIVDNMAKLRRRLSRPPSQAASNSGVDAAFEVR